MKHSTIRLAGILCLGLFATSCVTTVKGEPEKSERPESDWVLPSRALRDDIETQAAALPYRHGGERVEVIAWFAGVGEPAYETLLAFLDDDRPEVVATVLAALGATGDHRLVPHLIAAERPEWIGSLRLEYARARVRLGDWDAMPTLIEGLESEDRFLRALCVESLFSATNERFGYAASLALPERQAAVQRWREWWDRRTNDLMLAKSE
ncbi:MAG: hypothetical protein P1V81_02495 [Planctomycetota bacterium]|nr:hypothetical protein [Planctomycetota bacterium]